MAGGPRSVAGALDGGAGVLGLATSTASFLRGQWNLARELHDYRSGQCGSLRGSARFQPAPSDDGSSWLDYQEHGELTFGGHRGPASRSLRYRDLPDGTADVLFSDGRAFYRLDLRAGRCEAEHLCGADQYLVCVRVVSGDSFTETWRVTGPAKDYEMTTAYVRTGSLE